MQTGSNADHNYLVFFNSPGWVLREPKQQYLLTPLGRFQTYWTWLQSLSEQSILDMNLNPQIEAEILDQLWSELTPHERVSLEVQIARELEFPRRIPNYT